MALIVQDATGTVAGANGYVSVADFRAWHADRGQTFTQTDEEIEQAIVKATDYIDTRFTISGEQKADGQTTEFPRYGESDDALNVHVVTACIVFAAASMGEELWKTTEEAAESNLQSHSEGTGPLTEAKTWFSPASTKKAFAQADALVEKSGYVSTRRILLSRI